jgi:hypothetical protein
MVTVNVVPRQPARDRQCAAVQPDQLADEREPDAGALMRAGAALTR